MTGDTPAGGTTFLAASSTLKWLGGMSGSATCLTVTTMLNGMGPPFCSRCRLPLLRRIGVAHLDERGVRSDELAELQASNTDHRTKASRCAWTSSSPRASNQ